MAKIGVWSIEENGPVRIEETAIDFERDLEDWIEADPALLQAGLTIVGRQFPVEGGRIDLLAIDPQGRWTVIEIKRNALARDAVAQAIDYGACIAGESDEDIERKANEYLSRRGVTLQKVLSDVAENEDGDGVGREIQLFIVGTGSQRGLERMMKFLSERHGVPITAFTFDAFRGPSGRRLLVRAFAEADVKELEQAIYTTGFYVNKARAIKNSARELVDRFGGEIPRTLDELVTLPGVGRKTASVVLGAGVGLAEGVVLDTHVARITRMHALTAEKDPVKIERNLMALLTRKDWIGYSHMLIVHGRSICVARRPRCGECFLGELCPSAKSV